MFHAEQTMIESKIAEFCSTNNLPEIQLEWKGIPFNGHWGISTSFFKLAAAEAKTGKKVVVPKRAQEIAESVSSYLGELPGFSSIEAVNGYLNLYYSTSDYAYRVVNEVLSKKDDFGRGLSKNKKIMVEFSQPNTHKAFHVGHLRNVIFGNAICNLMDFAGYDVIRTNYLGDIGLHVIKWMWNYLKNHDGETPGEDLTKWMGAIYSEADKLYSASDEAKAEVKQLFARWDRRDADVVELWEKTRQWSLDGFKQIYDLLNVKFDKYYYESDVEDSGKVVVDELIAKGIAIDERPENAVIVKLDEILGLEEKYRVLVVLRSDGTSLYSTKDLSLAIKKFEDYQLDRSIYVIDVRQSLYMQQIYKTLELMGYEWAKDCYHLAYEIVNLPGNVTMKSREGTVVLLEDLIREATQRALEIVQEKNADLDSETQKVIASSVALGSIKYPMLSRDNKKVVTFDWESALDFNGQASPYIQYAHVRAGSILRKVDYQLPQLGMPGYELAEAEIQLIEVISRLPKEIQRAADDFHVLSLANLAYDLSRAFSDFYNNCPVLSVDDETKNFRLNLVAAAKQTINNALNVLGIDAPDAM